jgi:uncharacterized protein
MELPAEKADRRRFIADAMLGALARWLRVLDYDVAYDAELDDEALVELAIHEKRTILTRDRRLVERRMARNHLLIRDDAVAAQLRQVIDEQGLEVRRAALFGRCLRCNRPLADEPAEAVRSEVPPFVAATQRRFRRCPACRRLYWSATHVDRMVARFEEMGIELL